MKASLQNIGNIFAEPSTAFSDLKSEPRWGLAFLVFYLFSVLIGWAEMPYTVTLIDESLAENMQTEATGSVTQIMKSIGVFFLPLFALLGFVIQSAILKLAARFFVKNAGLTFKHIYAAVVHISLIGCVGELVNALLLLLFKDPESVKSSMDVNMIPGLHLLLGSSENVKLLTFLSHINPMSFWVVAVVALAISELTDMEKSRARVAAVILWGLSILPGVIFAS